jgi:hypothetical protein
LVQPHVAYAHWRNIDMNTLRERCFHANPVANADRVD